MAAPHGALPAHFQHTRANNMFPVRHSKGTEERAHRDRSPSRNPPPKPLRELAPAYPPEFESCDCCGRANLVKPSGAILDANFEQQRCSQCHRSLCRQCYFVDGSATKGFCAKCMSRRNSLAVSTRDRMRCCKRYAVRYEVRVQELSEEPQKEKHQEQQDQEQNPASSTYYARRHDAVQCTRDIARSYVGEPGEIHNPSNPNAVFEGWSITANDARSRTTMRHPQHKICIELIDSFN